MNKVHLIIGILAIIIGLFLIGFGIWKVYKDETATTPSLKSTNLGWGLILGGVIFLAAGVIVLVAGRSSNVSVTASTKKAV